MGFLTVRISTISAYLVERVRHGAAEVMGSVEDEVLFVLDGIGGFQFGPVLVRAALRKERIPLGTVLFDWQYGLPGEIFTDLMWLRRNRLMGAKLARKLLSFRRQHPAAKIHLLAFSGGAGIALFACEGLRGRRIIDTLALACPAVSSQYNLAPALRAVQRCYALVSRRDRWVLGLGTRILGTTDRCFSAAAGMVGFAIPLGCSQEELKSYQRLREIRWSPDLLREGHRGGHTSWATVPFLRRHLLPILAGEPRLPVHQILLG